LLPIWRFTLGKRDALLVLKALGGRLTSEESRAAAAELGDRLTVQRAAVTRDLVYHMERAENAALTKDKP